MRSNKKTLLLSAVTLGLLTSSLNPGLVSASAEAGNGNGNGDAAVEDPAEDISKENGTTYHVVRSGETVFSISNKYGISQEALRVWNNISNDIIHVDQILSVNGVNIYRELVKETNEFTSTQQFINQVAPIALEVAAKYDLYPSVMIAQATLETGSGKSELAVLANNFFGIKGTYKGNSIYKMSPEEVNGNMVSHSSRFRVYPNLYASFEDNGKRLRKGPNGDSEEASWKAENYQETWVENAYTYRDATQGLVNGGYATDSNYATKLNNIIEAYDLVKYDKKIYDFVEERQEKPVSTGSSNTAPEKTPADSFVASAKLLPNVSEIQTMTATELTELQEELANIRTAYSHLSDQDKQQSSVITWANYVQIKEEAVQKSLSENTTEDTPENNPEDTPNDYSSEAVGKEFITAARGLPNISEIEQMNGSQLSVLQSEIASVRDLFNDLPSAAQEREDIARWTGYLSAKESTANALLVNGEEFISTVRSLPNVDSIEEMNKSKLLTLEEEMTSVRFLYDVLPSSTQEMANVVHWEGYLTEKEVAVNNQLIEEKMNALIHSFLTAARNQPVISEIEQMNISQLKTTQSEMTSVRDLYNDLPSAAQGDTEVARWEGYLSTKESKANVLLENSENFLLAARALPTVATIEELNESQLLTLEEEMDTVRSLYNILSSSIQENANITRWEGFLSEKESAVYSLLYADEEFITAARALPNIVVIEEMSHSQLIVLEEEISAVRSLYTDLSSNDKSNSKVAQWAGYLTEKENTLEVQLIVTAEQEAIAEFLDAADNLPNVSEIKRMSVGRLRNLEKGFINVRAIYDNLTHSQKRNEEVITWETYLTKKEETVVKIQASTDGFVDEARALPSISEINRMNGTQLEKVSDELDAVRKSYNKLTPAAQTFSHVITWESYLTEKENAIFGVSSVRLNYDIKYGVERGDTLNSIAEKFQVNLNRLLARNSNIDPENLKTGETIIVPNAVARPMDHAQARDGKHVIYLDAGHGGWEPGASFYGVKEKDLNLNIGRKLMNRLETLGYEVVNVRTNDQRVSLENRSKDANASNADIFVSLHHNSMGRANSSVSGIETFYYKYARGYNPSINQGYHNDGARLANSVYLSHLIQNNLVGATGANYRRVAGQSFAVLRETNIPATLVEFGFMDNKQELNKLKNGSYQNKMVNAVASAIDTYFKALYN